MNKILHPIKAIQEWAIKSVLKRFMNELPVAETKLRGLWKEHEDEILDKVFEAIRTTITTFISKALEKQDNKDSNNAKNNGFWF